MIKIFEIITSVNLGGAENFTFTLIDQCTQLHPEKFEFIVVELYASKTRYAYRKKVELRSKGVKVLTLGGTNKRSSLPVAPIMLLHHIRKEKPHVIHAHTDLPDLVLSLAMKVKRPASKIVRTIHNTELWGDHPTIGKFVESSFKDDSIVGVSQAALEAYFTMRKKYGLSIAHDAQVIYNGCALPFRESHHFALDENKVNIAFCGRFVHQKGVDVLVDVIEKLDKKFDAKICFHFVGDGPLKEKVTTLANERKNVLMYGAVGNLAGKIYDFDYLIVPSRFEGLGLISIESSLSKVPVIAAKAPGLDETLPEDWPLFFNLNRKDELVDIFEKIINAAFDHQQLQEDAFTFVSKKFSMVEMAAGYSSIYLSQ